MSSLLSPRPLAARLAAPRRRKAFLRPLVISVLAACMAVGVRAAEVHLGAAPGFLDMSREVARTFMATVAGAMITATIVVFWVRGLLVSTHSGRIPNRVLSDYLADRYQQWVMGAMVGVFTFATVSLVALSVGEADGAAQQSAGGLSVVATTGLAIVALLMIIQSIDTGVRSMHEERLMRRVMESALEVIERDYPRVGDRTEEDLVWPDREAVETVRSEEIGWVRDVDEDRLLDQLPENATVWLEARVGDFVTPATSLCRVSSTPEGGLDDAAVRQAYRLSDTRDPDGDLSLALRNLVDIATGALVDGTGRTTAREAIAHLGALLRPIVAWDGPPRTRCHEGGRRLVRQVEPDYAHYLQEAFEDLARLGSDPMTSRALLAVIDELIEAATEAGHSERVNVLERHAELVAEQSRQDHAVDSDRGLTGAGLS